MDALWVGVDTYRNTLQKTDIKADPVKNKTTQCQNSVEVVVVVRGVAVERHSLVPLDGRADNLDKRQGDLGVPLLGRLRTGTTGTRIVSVCV